MSGSRLRSSKSGAAGALAVAALALAGCGSSSSSASSSSSSSSTSAAKVGIVVRLQTVPGVPSPSGAVPASTAGIKKLVVVHRGSFASHIKGLDNVPITQQIPIVAGDLNAFWSSEFSKSGLQWPQVQQALVQSQAVQTGCSTPATLAPTDPPLVCFGQSGTVVFWTVPWMQQNVDSDTGGVDLAFNMAELFSLVVQNQLGTVKEAPGQSARSRHVLGAEPLSGGRLRELTQQPPAAGAGGRANRQPVPRRDVLRWQRAELERHRGTAEAGVPRRLQQRQPGHLPDFRGVVESRYIDRHLDRDVHRYLHRHGDRRDLDGSFARGSRDRRVASRRRSVRTFGGSDFRTAKGGLRPTNSRARGAPHGQAR